MSLAIRSIDHSPSHAPTRSFVPWGTRRAKVLRVGVFDKRDSEYRVQSIQNESVSEPYDSIGDEAAYPRDILETRLGDIEGLVLPILADWREGPPGALQNDRQLVVFSAYLAVVHAHLPTGSGERSLSGEGGRALGEGDVRIELGPNHAARLSLHVPEIAFRAFRAMRWRAVEAPEGSEFITSDLPVNIFVADEPSVGVEEGLLSPTAEATFPISPRMCLVGRRDRSRGRARSSGVLEVNQRQARAADRFVYFRTQTDGVEEAMKSAEQKPEQPNAEDDLTPVWE